MPLFGISEYKNGKLSKLGIIGIGYLSIILKFVQFFKSCKMDIFDKIKSNRGALGQYSDLADGYFMFPNLRERSPPE